jgi:integrase
MTAQKRRPKGGIGITKRGNKYEATYSIPKDQLPPGKDRQRITAWGQTEITATAALIDKLRQTNIAPELPGKITKAEEKAARKWLGPDGEEIKSPRRAKHSGDSGPLLEDWAAEWQEHWLGGIQDSTKGVYFGHIETYILPYLGKYYLNELSAMVLKTKWWDPIGKLKKVKNGLVTEEPLLGNATKSNIYKTLHIVLTTAHHKLGTRISLSDKLIKPPTHTRPETDREVKAAAKKLRRLFIDEPNRDDPEWSLFALSLVGLRQGERLAIRVQDIDLTDPDDPVLLIHQQLDYAKPKGGWYLKNITKNGEPREVPLWGVFEEAVKKQLEWRAKWSSRPDWKPDPKFADLLFLQPQGKLWTRRQDTPAWRKYVGPGIRGHLARHVTGHILAEEGIGLEAAKMLLGHKSDAWAHFYRVASTRTARQELQNITRRQNSEATITDIRTGRRRAQ